MFDRISIGVRDLAGAGRFYDALLAPLGHTRTWNEAGEMAYGRSGERVFWMYPVAGAQVAGLGVHIALRAETREAVDDAYAASIAHGARAVRAAGSHPDIAPDYYGAIILDPDGNKIEIVLGAMH